MYRTLQFQLAGISVRATLAWLIIIVILAGISLGESAPDVLAGESVTTQVVVLLVLVAGPLLTLALHEAAHVMAARRCGASIAAVSPQLAGALPDTLYEADNPANEVRVGIAGPVVSALLGVLVGGCWWLTRDLAGDAISSAIGLVPHGRPVHGHENRRLCRLRCRDGRHDSRSAASGQRWRTRRLGILDSCHRLHDQP
jgi:hypothetical protein